MSLLNNVLPFVTARGETGNDVEQRDEIIRLLLDSTGEGIYGTDMDGVCTFANPACVRLLGFKSEQDLLGKNMHELVHHTRPNGEPYPMSECQIYRAFREQIGVHVDDEVMFCADGTSFPAEYWSYPVTRDDELVGCVLTFTDIRERRAAEDELQQQHDLVRLLLDSTAEGIYGIDLEGNCTFANPACVELLGFESEADLLGQQMHQLVHHTRPNGDPYPVKECQIYRAFWEHTGVHVDDELMFCQGGTSFEAEYWSYPIEKDGELLGCVLTFVDITERRVAERAIRQQEELVRLLLQSTGEGLYGFDLDGNCTFANDACVRLLGYQTDQDLLGQQMHKLVHHHLPNGEPYPVEQCQIYKALQVRSGVHVDDEIMFCADGTSFPAEYWSYPMFQDDELIGCVLTFVDITERKRIEAELARQHQELEVEKAKSEALLLNILPESIADELKAGTAVIADGVSEVTLAPRRLANWTVAEPTPPEAPVTSTWSPSPTWARCSMFSEVPYAQGIDPSSTSVQSQSTGKTSAAGTATYSANAPSESAPIHACSIESKPDGRMHGRTSTRAPTIDPSTSGATAMTRPQQSVPWISGNGVASFHPPSATCVTRSCSGLAASSVLKLTAAEYQPSLVLISVLLTPAASTRIST